MRSALGEKLGREAIARPDQLARKLDITIEPTEGGFRAALTLLDRGGKTVSRAVSAPTCAQAAEAIVVVAALAARAQREVGPAEAEPKPKATDEPKPATVAPPPVVPAPPPSVPPKPDPVRAEAFVALGVATGVGPTLSPGVALGARARFASTGPSVALSASAHDSFRTDADGIDARFRRVAVRGELCPYEPAFSSSVALSPCLGFELGAHSGEAYEDGVRVVRSRSESLLWSQASLALRLRITSEPVVVDFGPELGVAFTRNQFALTGTPDDIVFQVPRFTAGGRAAIALIF